MKNVKNLILAAILVISALSDTATCAAPFPSTLQTAATLYFCTALPISTFTIMHGVSGNHVFANMIETYKESGPLASGAQFFVGMVPSFFYNRSVPPHFFYSRSVPPHYPTIIIGVLGMATSCAMMSCFDNRIKPQQQSININDKKKEKEHTD